MKKSFVKALMISALGCMAFGGKTGAQELVGIAAEINSAYVEDGIYMIINASDSQMVMGVTGGYWDDVTELLCLEDNGKNYEKFEITQNGDGYYSIQAVHSDKYIQESNGDGILRQYEELIEDNNEKFQFVDVGDGSYYIVGENGKYVGVENGEVKVGSRIMFSDQASSWNLIPSSKNEDEVTLAVKEGDFVELEEGTYEISSALNGTVCWAISQDPGDEVSPVILWERVFDNTQKFYIQKAWQAADGGSLYSIRPIDSEQVLRKTDNNYIEPTDYAENNGAQLWQFVYGGFGRYLIRNVEEVFVCCVDGKIDNGTGLQLRTYEEVDDSNYLYWFVQKTDEY